MASKQKTSKKRKFLEWLGLGMGTVCARTWKFAGGHTVVLEHDCMLGRRVVIVDGAEIYRKTVFPDR